MSTAEFLLKITAPVTTSPGELMLMILKFSITHTLSLTSICYLIKLINNIFVISILPESRYLIDKLFNYGRKAHYHAFAQTVQIT